MTDNHDTASYRKILGKGQPSIGWKWGQGGAEGFFKGAALLQKFMAEARLMGDEAEKRHFLLGTLFLRKGEFFTLNKCFLSWTRKISYI